jgi:Tfp pilus assembly protein PilN
MDRTRVVRQGVHRLTSAFRHADRAHFHINLSSHYRSYIAPIRLGLIGLCGLLLACMVWDAGQIMLAYQESSMLGRELDRVREQDRQLLAEASQEGLDLSDAAVQRLPTEVALANQLLEKMMFSWTTFLTGLEQAIPPRLALSSVRLEAGGTGVRLTGTAMSLEDITAFTVGLQDHPTFKDPVLAQHRTGPNGLVEFDVTLRYRREGI